MHTPKQCPDGNLDAGTPISRPARMSDKSTAIAKLPVMAKVQLGAYGLFLLTTAFGLFGLTIFCLGKLETWFKWLDFSVFNRPVSAVICDWGIVSYIAVIIIFVVFRRSFGQTAPQLLEYLENCGKKRPDRGGDRF